jgi:hypothetical protein
MKIKILKNIMLILAVAVLIGISSCRKYNSLGFTRGTGAPTITSVHTYYKMDTANVTSTITTYNSSGNASTTTVVRSGQPHAFDSITRAGNLGDYYLIEGANLGSATAITFNGFSAYFNRAMITDHSILVQIPSKTPYYGPHATDSLVVTTLYGKAYYKFSIIPPPPTVSSLSDFNFRAGSQIMLTGVGFASVTSVGLTGTNAACTIISQTDSTMTLQFPSTNVSQVNLVFTYSAGTATSTQELVDVDNAYQIFTDNYQNGWGSWSWGPASPSAKVVKSGTASFSAQFGANSWWIDGFRQGGGGATDGVPFTNGYNYLSFWVFGGSADETVYIEFGNAGFANSKPGNFINAIDVPPGVWTYYKIPVSSLLWNTSAANWSANSAALLNTVAFFMPGNTVTETLYFDDVILIK